jgi:hypothetical protein
MRKVKLPHEYFKQKINLEPYSKYHYEGSNCMSKKSKGRDFWIFVGPALFAITMVVIIPFIIGIYYTFTNYNGANPDYDFIG